MEESNSVNWEKNRDKNHSNFKKFYFFYKKHIFFEEITAKPKNLNLVNLLIYVKRLLNKQNTI